MSVLFADLVGSTALAEARDIEDVRAALDAYHDAARTTLERFGGTVEKFIGDAVVAVFGAPRAHEDDPERAVRAALAVRDQVLALPGDLHLRIGVQTGEALVALDARPELGEGIATGDVLNTAARLQAAAPVDGVLVGEATRRATSTRIAYAEHPPIGAKGKSEPVACAVVTGLLARSRVQSPIVGREDERQTLLDALARSQAERRPLLVTVLGEAGIGKSRLVAELSRFDAVTLLEGRVQPFGEGSLRALAEIVRQQCGIRESDDAEVAATKLTEAVTDAALEAADARFAVRQLSLLLGLPGAAAGGGLQEAFAGWRSFLAAIALGQPTVLLVEDLHWADALLLDFLEQLVERAGSIPLLVVCTARPVLLEQRPGWGVIPGALTLVLGPLALEQIATLVDGAVDASLLSDDARRELLDHAAGNALYALEFARTVAESGERAMATVPATIGGIIAARLDGLPLSEKALIQDAAVLGETAWLEALERLGARGPDETAQLAERLEHKQLLFRQSSSTLAGHVEVRFSHALVVEVAYRQMTRRAREQRHRAAADWIAVARAESGDAAELAAYHLCAALDLGSALGDVDVELRDITRLTLLVAARQADARHDHQATIRHATAGLALDPDEQERAELLVRRVLAQPRVDAAFRDALEEARAAAVEAGRLEEAIRTYMTLASTATDASTAEDHLVEALALAEQLPPCAISAAPRRARAEDLMKRGLPRDAIAFLEPHIAQAGAAGETIAEALLRSTRGNALVDLGDPIGTDEMRAAYEALLAADHSASWHVGGNLGLALFALGRTTEAVGLMHSAVEITRRQGLSHGECDAMHYVGWLTFHETGDRGALEFVNASEVMAATFGSVMTPDIGVSKGWIVWRDQPAVALRSADDALASGAWTRDEMRLVECHALRACALDRLRSAESAVALDSFLAAWHRFASKDNNPSMLAEVAIVLAARDRHGDLARAAEPLAPRPWREALLLLAARREREAAAVFEAMPSIPLRDAALELAGRASGGA